MATRDRIKNLFSKIDDKDLKRIIAEVVMIERKNRTSSRERFPWKDVRTVIDAVARAIEIEKEEK